MCFLPRRALSVSDCEIARAYKIAGNSVEPIAFIVPRKVSCLKPSLPTLTHSVQADSFQADIFPLAPSAEPALTAGEFFSGKTAPPKLVSLENGAISYGAPPSAPPPAAAPTPTRTTSAPAPQPEPTPRRSEPASVVTSPVVSPPVSRNMSYAPAGDDGAVTELKDENAKLTSELREAREKIRNLELQVESFRANARKAAALLEQ